MSKRSDSGQSVGEYEAQFYAEEPEFESEHESESDAPEPSYAADPTGAFCPECGTALETGSRRPSVGEEFFCDAACARKARSRAKGSAFVEKHVWRRVNAPKPWRPRAADVLYGYYAGRTEKHGPYGAYGVVLVRDLDGRTLWMVSGVGILNLVDAAAMSEGQAMAVTYVGSVDRPSGTGYYKQFQLHVATTSEEP